MDKNTTKMYKTFEEKKSDQISNIRIKNFSLF